MDLRTTRFLTCMRITKFVRLLGTYGSWSKVLKAALMEYAQQRKYKTMLAKKHAERAVRAAAGDGKGRSRRVRSPGSHTVVVVVGTAAKPKLSTIRPPAAPAAPTGLGAAGLQGGAACAGLCAAAAYLVVGEHRPCYNDALGYQPC